MKENKVMLDLVLTHHDEPWDIVKPMFDSIQLQRGVNFKKVNIILVQDGYEGALNWKELLSQYSYKVKVLTIEHSGAATARNVGLKYVQGDWIMFCDIDDLFCDACALAMILDLLPTDECDIIWGKYVIEMIWRKGQPYMQTVDTMNFMNTTCKLYRRQFLEEKHIRFNTQIHAQYEYAFNAICLTETPPFRIRRLTTDFYPYFKTYRKDSMRTKLDFYRYAVPLLSEANFILSNELKARGYVDDAAHYAARAFCLNYYAIHDPVSKDRPCTPDEKSAELYKAYGKMVESVPDTDLEVIRNETEAMVMQYIQRMYNEHKKEYYLYNDQLSFIEWLDKICCYKPAPGNLVKADKPAAKPEQLPPVPILLYKSHSDEPRIVVYCGTRNVYEEMLTSLKSLMYHTRIDKAYLLIEDDTFPFELPDCVATINVSGQQYFPEDGPNFENSWTYMCMMRAAYPEIFRQYNKILSLDVDIIVQDDISDLWDYDLTDYFLAGVPEKQRQKTEDDPIYINFGVVMMNLEKLRQENKQSEIIEVLNRKKVDCPEQTAYNEACAGHILPLPADYNSTVYSHITGKAERERVLHYAGQTFWKHYANVLKYSQLTWDEILFRYGVNDKTDEEAMTRMPNEQRIPRIVFMFGTRDWYHRMALSLKSLLRYTYIDTVYFMIEDDFFPEPLPPFVHCVNVSNQQYFPKDGPNYTSIYSYMVLLRAALPLIFPEIDIALCIDADTITQADISGIWDTDMTNKYMAAVKELHAIHGHDYYNCGVMLMNFAKMRQDYVPELAIKLLNEKYYRWKEQDVLNDLCRYRIAELPSCYNFAPGITERTIEPALVRHYIGGKSVKETMLRDAAEYENMSWNEIKAVDD